MMISSDAVRRAIGRENRLLERELRTDFIRGILIGLSIAAKIVGDLEVKQNLRNRNKN